MNRIGPPLAVFLLAVLPCLCHGTAPAGSPLDDQAWKRLEQGEVLVTGTSFTDPDGLKRLRGTAVAIIDTPPQQVWETIMDHNRFAEFMPSVEECRIVEEDGLSRVVSFRLKIAWAEIIYSLRLDYDPDRWHADCALDKSRPHRITDAHCTWDLEPLDGGTRTLLTYSLYVNSGWFIPAFIERFLTRRQFPNVLESVRNRAVSGGTWKK